MANLTQVNKLVQKTYAEIWKDWFSGLPDCTPATVTVDLNCTDSGYRHSRNLIIISFAEGNLNNYDILDSNQWPVWKVDLIHEMLHEYEKKVMTEPTDAGRDLYSKHRRQLGGPDHNELFYTAICDRAPYFKMTQEEFFHHI